MHEVCDHSTDYYLYYGHCPPGSPLAANGTPWWHWLIVALIGLAVVLIISSFLRIVQAYQKGVVFRLGKYARTVDPGVRFRWPLIESMQKISTQIETVELNPQQVITNDSVSLTIRAVVYYKVTNAADSVIKIDDVEDSIAQLAPAIMRRVIGKHSLEDTLSHNEGVDSDIKGELEQATNEWGVKIDRIELQDVQLPEGMRRAMSVKAEAQRDADAKIIAAQGERDAAKLLREAADEMDDKALELRRLQTYREIGTDRSTIIVVTSDGNTNGNAAATAAAGALAAQERAAAQPPEPMSLLPDEEEEHEHDDETD